MRTELAEARLALDCFDLEGARPATVGPLGRGLIHDTFLCRARVPGRTPRYVLQRLNRQVFPEVERLMDNVVRVVDHLHHQLRHLPVPERRRRGLELVPTTDGARWLHLPAAAWRLYRYVDGSVTVERARGPADAREAGRAFALFQHRLADLPDPPLHETIPGFHDTPRRLDALAAAAARDRCARAAEAASELRRLVDRRTLAGSLIRALERGELTRRTVHNDTKIDNVLFDRATGEALCVVDFDTTMPGLVAWDFGDQIRSTACRTGRDRRDRVDRALFGALAQGYLSEARVFLEPAEVESLVLGGLVVTLELAARFLTDHLEGDCYFKIDRPGHNLERARRALDLLEELERRRSELEGVVARC